MNVYMYENQGERQTMELLCLFHLQRTVCGIDSIIETDAFAEGKLSSTKHTEELMLYV